MTVVAVKKYNDKIVMSCDSQTTYGTRYKVEKMRETSPVKSDMGKIFIENDMLIGCSGAVSESNLLKLFARNHKPKSADVDGILEFLLEFRDYIAKRTAEPAYKIDNQTFGGKVFECYDMDVTERPTFWAIGSGMFLALSALHLGQTPEEAVNVAKQYDLYCGGETKTLSVNI